MTRVEMLHQLLDKAIAIENGLEIPQDAKRYVALEQRRSGDTMWAYFGDDLTEIQHALEESDTGFVERVRVHDLDTGAVFVSVWKIVDFGEIHG